MGNLPLDAAVVQFSSLPQDPNNEKQFLRYPKGSPLTEKGSPGVPTAGVSKWKHEAITSGPRNLTAALADLALPREI